MHPMHPVLANDLMQARTVQRPPRDSHRRLSAARPTRQGTALHPATRVRTWAGWHLVRVGLRLAVSPS
jgi:hypothetical protein